MITKRHLVIAVLCTFCLTVVLFTIVPVGSQGAWPYDPWWDLDDDGRIDISDLARVSGAFGTYGAPINKTALLYNVNDTFTELLARIDSLNNSNIELQSKVDLLNSSLLESQNTIDELNATVLGLHSQIDILNNTTLELQSRFDSLNASLLESQSRIDDLNASLTSQINVLITQMATMNMTISELRTDIAVLNATKLGKPDYDSGWTAVILGDTLIPHTCNTTNVIVYMIGKQTGGTAHQKDYGGWQNGVGSWYGAYWYDLTETHVRVHRHGNDGDWQLVRIFMWKIPQS